jgi:hypothetical protein
MISVQLLRSYNAGGDVPYREVLEVKTQTPTQMQFQYIFGSESERRLEHSRLAD